ncbi:SF1 family protein [Megaselia abdita]
MSGKHKEKDKDRSRSRSRSKNVEKKEKDRERSHKRDRSKSKDRKRSRSRSHSKRDRSRSRDKDRRSNYSSSRSDRDRDYTRDRDRRRRSRSRSLERRRERRDRERRSRDRCSRDRDYDRRDRDRFSRDRRSRSYDRDRKRSRSRSYRKSRERGNSRDRGAASSLATISEGFEAKFDLTQTISDLVNSTTSKNLAALLNCNNSNDSFGNNTLNDMGDDRSKKKKSRWGGTEHDKTFIPGMPTILPSTLDPTQQEAYLVQLQIEEVSRKLRTGELGVPQNPEERSPSPEPIYSSDGKRLNTREFRYRKKLEEQRHQLIQRMQCMNPEFKPPSDYKPPVVRVSDKVLIPQEEHPDINFVGLLIGPRGNTLKAMEKETGAKIIIRGKGSVKEGKVGRKDGQPLPGEDEPLHAFITASNPEAVKKAVEKIKEVITQGIEVPEGHNDLRRMQLRELAQLNGTLRETDTPRCSNCGSTEHKSWLCPDKPNVTNNIICTTCGGAGHIAKDCRSKRPGEGLPPSEDSQAKIDEEYLSLMAELGEGLAAPKSETSTTTIRGGLGLFDKISAPKAIAAAPPSLITTQVPPPPIVNTSWNSSNGGSSTNQTTSVPPPPQLPSISLPPQIPPPLCPWLSPAPHVAQPPPPPPPGTAPLMPPGTAPLLPPGTAPNPPLPPW